MTFTTFSSNGRNNNNHHHSDHGGNAAIELVATNKTAGTKTDLQLAWHDDSLLDDDDGDAGHDDFGHASVALHGAASTSTSTEMAQITVNIIISFVGAGLLGIPQAFSRAGWFLGTVALMSISALNVYAMLLLPKVRTRLATERNVDCHSYGQLGKALLGQSGELLVNICLLISQMGFATAYLIFIAKTLGNRGVARWKVCFGCVPGLALLVQARDMKHLSPFSLLANLANLLGLSAVLVQDVETLEEPAAQRMQVDTEIEAMKWGGVLYVMAVTLYSMEGVGLVLSLEHSCRDRSQFPPLLCRVVGGITLFMALFGIAGYWAFGDETEAPITVNLGHGKAATLVQGALCVALYFTYPVMMFPVWTIAEEKLLHLSTSRGPGGGGAPAYQVAKSDESDADNADMEDTDWDMDDDDHEDDDDNDDAENDEFGDNRKLKNGITSSNGGDVDNDDKATEASHFHHVSQSRHACQRRSLRATVVLLTAVVAYAVPDFGEYLSLVGSSICTILGFLLPTYFHFQVCGHELSAWEYALNAFVFVGGALFAIVGTIQSASHMASTAIEEN